MTSRDTIQFPSQQSDSKSLIAMEQPQTYHPKGPISEIIHKLPSLLSESNRRLGFQSARRCERSEDVVHADSSNSREQQHRHGDKICIIDTTTKGALGGIEI